MGAETSSDKNVRTGMKEGGYPDPLMGSPYSIQSGWTDITPMGILPLAGFCTRTACFENVCSPLEADVIILQDEVKKVIFLSLDVLFIGGVLKEAILSRSKGTIKDDELFIWASHNHFAPSIDPDKPKIGICDPQYIEYVADRVATLIETILRTDPKKVHVSYGAAKDNDLIINRRKKALSLARRSSLVVPRWETQILPNKKQYRDGSISTILLKDQESGVPTALIWSFACHPVSSPGNNAVKAEYPGEIRRMLRAQFQSDIPIVFLQGLSGDIRPPSFVKYPRSGGYKKKVLHVASKTVKGNRFGSFDETDWTDYLNSLWNVVKTASRTDNRKDLGPGLDVRSSEVDLADLGINKDKKMKICSIKIGELRILAFSAEVVAEWERVINNIFQNEILIPTGCFEDVFGYLPTEDMIQDGGYEVEKFMDAFNISGKYRSGLEQQVAAALIKLK